MMYAYALSLNGSPLKMICFLSCVQWLLLILRLVWKKLDSFQNVVMQKTPIATNDMNFLVFNIKVCMVYVRSLNWANYAFQMSSSAFLSGCSSTG